MKIPAGTLPTIGATTWLRARWQESVLRLFFYALTGFAGLTKFVIGLRDLIQKVRELMDAALNLWRCF